MRACEACEVSWPSLARHSCEAVRDVRGRARRKPAPAIDMSGQSFAKQGGYGPLKVCAPAPLLSFRWQEAQRRFLPLIVADASHASREAGISCARSTIAALRQSRTIF